MIVLDIRMPGMDGLAALAEIKKINPEVEVIILSGHASMDAAMEINRLGGYDYLMKPCPLEELLLKIEAAYDKKVERQKRAPGGPIQAGLDKSSRQSLLPTPKGWRRLIPPIDRFRPPGLFPP